MKLFTASLTFLLLAVASASFGSIEKELEIPLLAHHFPVLDHVITNKHFIPNAHRSKRSIISDPLEFIENKFEAIKRDFIGSVQSLAEEAGNGIKYVLEAAKDEVEKVVKRDVLENVKAETREVEGKVEKGFEAVKGKVTKVIR